MADYRRHYNSRQTPQQEPIPGQDMVQNNAGGYAYPVDNWVQLERFLILGTEGGTYYVNEHPLTVENAQNVLTCIQHDGHRVVDTVVKISDAGRAPKNDPALFVLAMCAGMGDVTTRQYAFDNLHKVARIGTHLSHFAHFMEGFRGWGRVARRGIGNWFLNKSAEQLGLQALKYAQRDGWALRDLLRLSHPQTDDPQLNAVFKYIVNNKGEEGIQDVLGQLPTQILASRELCPEMALTKDGRQQAIDLILEHKLPREAVPNSLFNTPEVWEALLQSMPPMAMIRNLGKMTNVGLLKPLSAASKLVVDKLGDQQALQKARIHPINVLAALLTYQSGHGVRGKLTWNPVPQIVDALDGAFYDSFKFVVPTGKRILIGLDVSGSMAMSGSEVNGMQFLRAREASAAMAMFTARTESDWHIMGFSHEFISLAISPRQRLDDVVRTVSNLRFGATDCALPMLWAESNRVEVDAFMVYTDNETWWGKIHPSQALDRYRQKMGIPAKMIVNAMSATKFSIGKRTGRGYGMRFYDDPPAVADPNDGGMLDVAGLDSAAPQIMADFIRE